jgi:hypothetical protein
VERCVSLKLDRDVVPDQETALAIGLAILNAYYGRDFIARYEPYRAVLTRENWAVLGTSAADIERQELQRKLQPGYVIIASRGGAPEIEIRKKDSKVLSLALSR